MNGDPRFLVAEAGKAADLAEFILEVGWKYAHLSECGHTVAEVTLCPCGGGPPLRQVKLTEET